MTMTDDEQAVAETLPDIVNALAASPDFARDGVCFAARNSGLFRSDDGGRTWRNTYGALQLEIPLPTTAVALAPEFPSDPTVLAAVSEAILRSPDGGERWYAASLPLPGSLVTSFAISPRFAQDGVVLAGTMEDGVFRSADRGASWAGWNFGLLDLNIFTMAVSPAFADDETLFVGTLSGIFRSANGGRAWREVDFPAELAPVLSIALSPDWSRDGVMFAGTEEHGLWRSDDRGRTWTRQAADVMDDVVNAIVLSPRFPASPDMLAMTGDSLLVSRDGGSSWSEWQTGLRFEQGVASIVAPEGIDREAPVLVGLIEGGVVRV